ncbi:MAG TPA: zf-HC2 domain-containing protein, partial [Terriglobales bacterium]|nr:zf-HC2 domain-containing protein [Terriglobales bacterium]
MQQLPQTARLALGRAIASDGHPEPDQLAALVEQALSPDRRASILNHLAACYTCREEVSLILPQMSEVEAHQYEAHQYKEFKTAPQRFGLGWASLRSLPLRWAGVAATAAIIVGAVWVGRLEQPAANPAEAHVFRAEPEQPWTMTGSDTTSTTAAAVPAEAQQRSGASSLPSRQKTAVSDPQVIVASRGNAVQPFTTQQSETLNRTEALNRTETLNRTMSLTAAARRNGASQGVPAEAATMASNLASNQGPASNSNPVFNSLWTTGMVTAGAP